MRLVSWNIRHGGGKNAAAIATQLLAWEPDIVVLCEFRGTSPSQRIAGALAEAGFGHQIDTTDPDEPTRNSLFVATRISLSVLPANEIPIQHHFLPTQVANQSLTVLATHVPNRGEGPKYDFHDALVEYADAHSETAALLVGDTNTGEVGYGPARYRWVLSCHSAASVMRTVGL